MGDIPGLLPTTVVGSYSVPEWLERLKTDFHQRRISSQHLTEIHEVAIKAALKDQERAGIDIVSDGELRRDNDIDYLLARIPGVHIPQHGKTDYYDYYEAEVSRPLPETGEVRLGLAADYTFTRDQTDRPVKFSFTGPFSLSRRIRNLAYPAHGDLVRVLARRLNAEARELAAAGATRLQIDEPFLAGYPEDVALAVEAVNLVTEGVEVQWALHVCYGNRYARPSWEGQYDFLFPAVLDARVDQLVLEFARKGLDDLHLLRQYAWEGSLGFGVIDVKTNQVESAELVARRIRRALEFVPAEKLVVNPDCGLRHVPATVARAKLRAMVAGTALVRAELEPQNRRDEQSIPIRDDPGREPVPEGAGRVPDGQDRREAGPASGASRAHTASWAPAAPGPAGTSGLPAAGQGAGREAGQASDGETPGPVAADGGGNGRPGGRRRTAAGTTRKAR